MFAKLRVPPHYIWTSHRNYSREPFAPVPQTEGPLTALRTGDMLMWFWR